MKTLITLSVLQTIGIAALVVHAFHEPPPAAPEVRPASPLTSTVSSAPTGVDEVQLRTVIREELARLNVDSGTPTAAASKPRNPSVDRQRRDAIEQRIDAYSSAGSITDTEMLELQAEIAKLDESSRKQMMSKLVRALNSGDIKGRL